MKKTIHEELVDILKTHTPEGENTVDILTNIIPLSKEAAYRRLRGEIKFTLEDAVHIAIWSGISLDTILNIDKNGQHMFHIQKFFFDKPFEVYYDIIFESTRACAYVKKDPDALLYFAGNTLPPMLYMRFPLLNQYNFFKWFYQSPCIQSSSVQLKDVIVPDKVINIQQQLIREIDQINLCMIIGEDIFIALIKDIQHFYNIGLITPEELGSLKEEVAAMIDYVETMAANTHSTKGKKNMIYICNTYLNGNYALLNGRDFESSVIFIYGINQLDCNDPVICKTQKAWFSSLIGFSTLISGCGILSRTIFFDHQRKLLNSL